MIELSSGFLIVVAVNTVVILFTALLLAWLTPLPLLLIAILAIVAWIHWQIRLVDTWKKRRPLDRARR
jgi:hypothetical protein